MLQGIEAHKPKTNLRKRLLHRTP